jgi:hypothetical protein
MKRRIQGKEGEKDNKKNRGGEKVRIRKMRLPYSPEAIKSFFPEQGSGTGFPSILHELETGFSSLSEKYYILVLSKTASASQKLDNLQLAVGFLLKVTNFVYIHTLGTKKQRPIKVSRLAENFFFLP